MELEEQVIDSHSGKPGPASASARSYRSSYEDDAYLRRLGKRPMLNRNFGFMSILGFACSSLCSWEGILLSSVPGLMIGGPASLIWGLIFNWIGITSIYASLAELASIAPTTGGQCMPLLAHSQHIRFRTSC
jgi:amino acid permease